MGMDGKVRNPARQQQRNKKERRERKISRSTSNNPVLKILERPEAVLKD
jgi:hypothetical protein